MGNQQPSPNYIKFSDAVQRLDVSGYEKTKQIKLTTEIFHA